MNSVDELNLLLGIGPKRPQLPVTLRRSGYLPVRALGKGSYGQALLVFHEPRQQYFVVKHLNLAGMTSRQRHDAHNEINILQKLHHPNIVQYVEYYEEHPHLYIVMEYADGGDVFSLLSSAQAARKANARVFRGLGSTPATAANAASGLLSETQVVSLFVQTTMAVRYMHDRRLLHRDIKSSNIFLTKNHIVKLGDFGISTVLQSTMAMASTMCGTPCYFSPELCEGRPYNNKSDMWALGVLLYELCAGHVPFESTTMKTLMRDIVHKQPPRIPPIYSDALWELIVQLLQKDPRRRPDAGQVLISPALMKYVPELIEQLASDPAYAAAAKGNVRSDIHSKTPRAGELYLNEVVPGGRNSTSSAAAPPSPPPRYTEEKQKNTGMSDAANVAAVGSHLPPAASIGSREKLVSPSPSTPLPQESIAHAVSPVPKDNGGKVNKNSKADGLRAPSSSASPRPSDERDGTSAASLSSKQQQQQPPSSTASIAALLARFDARKQQLAENKQKKHAEEQQQQRQSNKEKTPHAQLAENGQHAVHQHDNALPGLQDKNENHYYHQQPRQQQQQRSKAVEGVALAHLSPGAAAALRQQGLDPERDSQTFSTTGCGGQVPQNRDVSHNCNSSNKSNFNHLIPLVPRRSFAPPPLPAALRDASNVLVKRSGDDEAGETPEWKKEGNDKHSESATSSHGRDIASSAAAARSTGSDELDAVLTELSTWRERSLRRQRKLDEGSNGSGGSGSHSTSANQVSDSNNGNGARTSGEKKGVVDGLGGTSSSPFSSSPQQRKSSELQERTNRSSVSPPNATSSGSGGGGVGDIVSSDFFGLNGRAQENSEGTKAELTSTSLRAKLTPPILTTGSPSSAQSSSAAQPQQGAGIVRTISSSSAAPQHKPRQQGREQKKESSDAKSSSQSPKAGRGSASLSLSTPASSPNRSTHAVQYAEDVDVTNSSAQSFTDAMGTTLDIHALQEASAPTSAAAGTLSGTAVRHAHQQFMHKSFRGTSEKINSLRETLKPGTVLLNTTAAGAKRKNELLNTEWLVAKRETHTIPSATDTNETNEKGGTTEGECEEEMYDAAADLHFTTACLCGRAATHSGCLSMIYGSFICTCGVCVRFTGAGQGIEWLHLPEVDSIESLLIPFTPPSDRNQSNSGRTEGDAHASSPELLPRCPSAGGGAAAAAALRAHVTPVSSHSPTNVKKQLSTAAAMASSAPFAFPNELLARAGIRSYTHQQAASLPDEEEGEETNFDSKEELNDAEAVETYVLYTCATCSGMVGILHDGVLGLLLPKTSLDEQSLRILSSCAQTVELDGGSEE